jgi:hypothetical protein
MMALLCNNIETNYQDNSREVFVLEKLPNNEYRSSIKCFNAGVSDRTPFINIGIDRILVRQFTSRKYLMQAKNGQFETAKLQYGLCEQVLCNEASGQNATCHLCLFSIQLQC